MVRAAVERAPASAAVASTEQAGAPLVGERGALPERREERGEAEGEGLGVERLEGCAGGLWERVGGCEEEHRR